MKRVILFCASACAALAIAGAAAAAVTSGTYVGTTSQKARDPKTHKIRHGKVRVVVVPGKVKLLKFELRLKCLVHTKGRYVNTFLFHNGPIVKGKISDTTSFQFKGPNGTRAIATPNVTGSFDKPGHVKGKIAMIITFLTSTGGSYDRCSASGVTWSATLK